MKKPYNVFCNPNNRIQTNFKTKKPSETSSENRNRHWLLFMLFLGIIMPGQALQAATYYWIGPGISMGGSGIVLDTKFSTAANWNTAANGSGSIRATPSTNDIFIFDGDGTTTGGPSTVTMDGSSFTVGQIIVTNGTTLTMKGSVASTITISGGSGDDFVIDSGSTLVLNATGIAPSYPVSFVFSGADNTGLIAGTLKFSNSTSNVLNTTGGTGTMVTVTGTVELGAQGNSLIGTLGTLTFANGSNCNSTATTTDMTMMGDPVSLFLPLATWGATSNLTISGATDGTSVSNVAQTFGNVTVNAPNAATIIHFGLSSATTVQGDFNVISTGTGRIVPVTSGLLTVNGNINISGGTVDFGNALVTTVNIKLKGNFVQTGGNLMRSNASNEAILELNGTDSQTFTPATFATGAYMNLMINNSAGVDLTANMPIKFLTVTSGNLTGTGLLTYLAGSKLTYNGTEAQTATRTEFPVANGPYSLTVNNTATAPNNVITMPFDATLGGTTAGTLFLTKGIIDNSGYTFTIQNPSTSIMNPAISGGSSLSFIKGSLERNLAANLSATGTYNFPVGKSGYNPLAIISPTTSGLVTLKVEANDGATGGTPGTSLASLSSARYWKTAITNGNANFTSSFIRLTDAPLDGANAIGGSDTLDGTYNLVGGLVTTIGPASVTSTAPAATTLSNYYVLATETLPTITDIVITPTGNSCTNVLRTVTATVTPGATAISTVVINYSVDGTAQAPITMTNTSGDVWTGDIPTVTPSNGLVAWSIKATDVNTGFKTEVGTPYSDFIPDAPTVTPTEATCTADGSTTISNYDTTLTYSFSPEGPAVDATGLISGATVATEYTVTAVNGTCPSATTATFTNAAMTGPAVPTIVATEPTCTANGSTTISNYDAALTYTFSPEGPAVDETGLVSGATAATEYTVTAGNETCTSLTATFTNAAMTGPAVPTIVATEPTCTANGSTTISNYDAALTYTFSPEGPAVDETGLVSGATAATEYTVTAGNETCTSLTATFTNAAMTGPAAPIVALSPASCSANGYATISFFDGNLIYSFNPAGPSFDDIGFILGATPGATYTITAGNGTCTSTSTTFTIPEMLATPAAPTGSAEQTIGVDVDTDATIEDLLVTNSNGSWYASEAEALATTNALPAGTLLVSGTTYYTVNVSTNGCVSTAFAVTVTVTLKNESFDSKSFSYYPNPTLGVVNFNYANPITNIKVTNMLGQEVITQKVNATSTQVDLSSIAKGAYFIEVTSDKVSKTVKIIKN